MILHVFHVILYVFHVILYGFYMILYVFREGCEPMLSTSLFRFPLSGFGPSVFVAAPAMTANADILQVGTLNTDIRAPSIEGPHGSNHAPSSYSAIHSLSEPESHVGRPSEFNYVSDLHVFGDVVFEVSGNSSFQSLGSPHTSAVSKADCFENFPEIFSVPASGVDG